MVSVTVDVCLSQSCVEEVMFVLRVATTETANANIINFNCQNMSLILCSHTE